MLVPLAEPSGVESGILLRYLLNPDLQAEADPYGSLHLPHPCGSQAGSYKGLRTPTTYNWDIIALTAMN
jgi:hypothetical protein